MFARVRHPSAPSPGHGAYTRLQQQDDLDDDYDDLIAHTCIARHPNSILVSSNYHTTTVPILPKGQSLPDNEATHDLQDEQQQEQAGGGGGSGSASGNTFTQRASFSAKRAAELPTATRQFIQSKLPFRRKTANEASFASLPSVIMADIQQGDMPGQADPLLKELPKRGWTIVRRRRFRGRRRMVGKKSTRRGSLDDDTTTAHDQHTLAFDKMLMPTDPLSTSVFVKWDPASEDATTPGHIPSMHDTYAVQQAPKDIPVSKNGFSTIVESVRSAIQEDIQPTRISQGSSGSYFCRNGRGKTVGVFKPKNEEPYGRLNPKWTKWIHRHLFPCCFGRSCLIPNLGYISEAASSTIDRRIGTRIVPHTGVVHLASPSFHYDYLDRRSASVVGLPPKIGSFQCFLDGFKDANVFLREYPFPSDPYTSSSFVSRGSSVWGGCLGQQQEEEEEEEENQEDDVIEHQQHPHHGYPRVPEMSEDHLDTRQRQSPIPSKQRPFRWTRHLQDQFKLEFEQLVILDYLIRNTDRGLDNWMIKYCEGGSSSGSSSPTNGSNATLTDTAARGYIQIAAIDNGLAFPFKHPDEWRSYPYGWLALPDALVSRPFSATTRRQFLKVLSDPVWWRDTVRELHEMFQLDSDFDEHMFQRQMAVLKGQGFNIVRALSDPNASPLDLVSTERVVVNQEEILIEYDEHLIKQRSNKQPGNTTPEQRLYRSPRPHHPPQPARRLRTKRSTSFDLSMHRPQQHTADDDEDDDDDEDAQQQRQHNGYRPIQPTPRKNRGWGRVSLDIGRRRRRRIMRNLRLGKRHVGSDGEEEDSSSDDDDHDNPRKRVTLIMETIEVVKSRTPYFTCC